MIELNKERKKSLEAKISIKNILEEAGTMLEANIVSQKLQQHVIAPLKHTVEQDMKQLPFRGHTTWKNTSFIY